MGLCDFRHVLEQLMGPVGIAAAGFWFAAAWMGRGGFLLAVIGEFDRDMKRQAWLNAVAAFLTGVAALIQVALASYLPVCRDFG
jgi:hypothetical protein